MSIRNHMRCLLSFPTKLFLPLFHFVPYSRPHKKGRQSGTKAKSPTPPKVKEPSTAPPSKVEKTPTSNYRGVSYSKQDKKYVALIEYGGKLQCLGYYAFETDAANMTYNYNDGRCICMDTTAVLATSTELSTAFSNECYSGLLSTNLIESDTKNQLIIYPNPTNSKLTFKTYQTSFSERDRIQLFSIIGEQLYSSRINSEKTTVDLSHFPRGTYILTTSINGIQKTFKILKE